MSSENRARAELQRAMRLHAEERIEEALAAARHSIQIDPSFADALSYLGNTLITRKGHYLEGLRALEAAREAAPEDPFIRYTLGWCYEYVAHEWPRGRPAPQGFPSVDELYRRAIAEFRACLAAGPDPDLRDDVVKLLEYLGERMEEEDEPTAKDGRALEA